jgi:hypothetical protein
MNEVCMKLYFAAETCSLSPHIVLRELNLPFELVRVNNKTKKTADGRDFLSINPKGYVAALETSLDSFFLNRSRPVAADRELYGPGRQACGRTSSA